MLLHKCFVKREWHFAILPHDQLTKKKIFYNKQNLISLCYKQNQIFNKLNLSWIDVFVLEYHCSCILNLAYVCTCLCKLKPTYLHVFACACLFTRLTIQGWMLSRSQSSCPTFCLSSTFHPLSYLSPCLPLLLCVLRSLCRYYPLHLCCRLGVRSFKTW